MQKQKFYQTDFIEAYLKGAVSEADKNAMNALLQADKDLHNEVIFQKDLVAAIRESRRNDLKKMLQNTPIPTHTGLPSVAKWILGSVAATIVVLVGIWMMGTPKEENTLGTTVHKETSQQENAVVTEKHHDKTIPESVEKAEKKETRTPETPKLKNSISEKKKEQSSSPFQKEIHYLYDGGTVLQLFGDIPYQIVEKVDLGNGEKNYIYIQNRFYELVPTGDEPKTLQETAVKNPEHIKLLTEKLPLK
jgi:hypothetical protein